MRGFEKNPELGAIFERVAAHAALKRAKRAMWRLPPIPAHVKALEERKFPDSPDLPVVPSPPLVPTDEARQRRLDLFAARESRKPRVPVVQLRFEF